LASGDPGPLGAGVLKLGILPGDDIGQKVVPGYGRVVRAAAGQVGPAVMLQELPIGPRGCEAHGHSIPEAATEVLGKLGAHWADPV